MPRDWDAATYDRIADPMARWGKPVVARLELRGDERVLDAGCGTGRVTQILLDRLADGSVVALDGSPSMIDKARDRLGEAGVDYIVADLMEPLPLDREVDAILSTATFHWVPDHDRLFRNLASVLIPGGRLEAQCGGAGNTASLLDVLREMGVDGLGTKVFPTPDATRARMEAAGYVDIRCWLQSEPTPIASTDFETYLRVICLGGILEDMLEADRDGFVREVAARMPGFTIDYVRLNISARRANTSSAESSDEK